MRKIYVDTSALARLYLTDEGESDNLESLLLATDVPVATSELSQVELARAVKAAERGGRVPSADHVLRTIDRHFGTVIGLVRLEPKSVLPEARRIVLAHRVRTLDAIHLAVARELSESMDIEALTFVTRDHGQAEAARALGFSVL